MMQVKPYPGMLITQDVRFEAGEYDFSGSEGIIISGDNITLDGNGAFLRGGCVKTGQGESSRTKAFSYAPKLAEDNGRSLGFFGTGIAIEGRNGVTVRNLRIAGFDQGLRVEYCRKIAIENCDFSDCFHDPAWGWDEHGCHGGILMSHTNESRVRNCKANRVWDALNLRHSHDNVIEYNDFSHTSDTALK